MPGYGNYVFMLCLALLVRCYLLMGMIIPPKYYFGRCTTPDLSRNQRQVSPNWDTFCMALHAGAQDYRFESLPLTMQLAPLQGHKTTNKILGGFNQFANVAVATGNDAVSVSREADTVTVSPPCKGSGRGFATPQVAYFLRSFGVARLARQAPWVPMGQNIQIINPRDCEQYNPQFGVECLSDSLLDLATQMGVKSSDELISTVEGVLCLVNTLRGCTGTGAMITAVMLFLRPMVSGSLLKSLETYVRDIFETFSQSDAVFDPGNGWVDFLRRVRSDWVAIRSNGLFSRFSKLLGLLVSLQLFSASSLTFSIGEYKIWEPEMDKVHKSAFDIADAIFGSVIFFVENISVCWGMRSLRPLFAGESAAVGLDDEYAMIVSHWKLVQSGNLQKVAGISEQEFHRRLEDLLARLKTLSETVKGLDKRIVMNKRTELLTILNDYITHKVNSGVRPSPFCIELYGPSSQGKTTLADQLLVGLLASQGLPTEDSYRAQFNPADKFMSNWKSDKLVMTIDDMANDKANFVERPPTRAIIDIANNSPFYANMASLENKGRVFVEPKFLMVTTNVKDLDAYSYSNCPYSIQRRMDVVITVKAKKEFQHVVDGQGQGIDTSKVYKSAQGEEALFDDIWELSVEKAVQPARLESVASYAPFEHEGKVYTNVGFRDVIQLLIKMNNAHTKHQAWLIERRKKRKNAPLCGIDGCNHIKGYCDAHDFMKQIGVELSLRHLEARYARAQQYFNLWSWFDIIPVWVSDHRYFRLAMAFLNRRRLLVEYTQTSSILWATYFVLLTFGLITKSPSVVRFAGLLLPCVVLLQTMVFDLVMTRITRDLREYSFAPVLERHRDRAIKALCVSSTVIASVYAMSKIYRRFRSVVPQGSLEPMTQEEVDARDAEGNVWTQVSRRVVTVNNEAKNTTSAQLKGLLLKNLVYGTIYVDDGSRLRANGLFLCSNVVLMPAHYFVADEINITFRKVNPETTGGKFATRLSLQQSVLLPNSDLRLCYTPNGGSFKNLVKYIPSVEIPSAQFEMLWRDKGGSVDTFKGLCSVGDASNGDINFRAYRYDTLSSDTFAGLCGAVVYSSRYPILMGVHVAGRSNSPRGCAGILIRSEVEQAIVSLKNLPATLITGSAEHFEKQVLGVRVLNDTPLHRKSPLNYLPHNSQIEYYGTCPGMTTFRSSAKVSLISESVMHIMGAPNVYRGPVETPQYFGWQTCLSNMAVPGLPYPTGLLLKAVKCLRQTLISVFERDLWNKACPLTHYQVLCGIAGLRFIDGMNMQSSIGFPLSGAKNEYRIDLQPDDEFPNKFDFTPEVLGEIYRCEECYKRGERAYVIAKACKKDEILSKAKCRIFFGNGIALTYLIRKYFLPLIRVLQCNPLRSECAVGINSHGPEWQALHNHVFTFGADRLIGGDYGKYDQKLPTQLLLASLRILIDCAKVCDYTDVDISVMEAMCGDIVYALVAFNGDLIGLTEGSHISGNSLTVILNGLCGSLNLRSYYYNNYPDRDCDFQDHVKLITYGDDNIGSVSEDTSRFTIKGASEFMGQYGQVYTMPDKESELKDFLPPDEFEFLKRKSVYHKDLNCTVGALSEKSCFKMLHCYLREKDSPLTEEHACAINIDTALREWFNHGEEIYELRRVQLREVAESCDIVHLCTQLDVSYGDAVSRWKDTYS